MSQKIFCSVRSLAVGLIVFLGIVIFTNVAIAADTGSIAVIITGDSNEGVVLQLSGPELTRAVEKRSDSSGAVAFTRLAPGDYAVTPKKSGIVFTPGVRNVTVRSGKSSRVRFSSAAMKAKVGMNYCISCHKTITSEVYSEWLNGPHGNFNYKDANGNEFDYGDFTNSFSYPSDYSKFSGHPNSSTINTALQDPAYRGKTEKYCLSCHGPSSIDNASVKKFPLVRPDGRVDTINRSAQVERPVVGCEACHGSGRTHISRPKKAVTYKEPAAVQCGQCHSNKFPNGHLGDHPLGAGGVNNPGIYEAYQTSPHASSNTDAELYTSSKKTAMTSLCAKCHSDQGSRFYKDIDGDASTLPPQLAGERAHKKFDAVQCRTCHNAHDPSSFLESATAATSLATARSAQFNTCTNCHQLLADNDGVITPFHNDHASSIVYSHVDNPGTAALEGFNVDRASDQACTVCHNPHDASTKINKQWAASGHGDLNAEPWNAFDWKSTSRQACQRCHTPTGFMNIVADQEHYNAANNDFSHLSGRQNDSLTCVGCHTDSSFKRRSIGAYGGKVRFPSGALVKLDDDSNLCMMCHQGRASKVDIDTKINAGPPPYTSFNNIHYLAAAATFFGTETLGGYEYAGKTYVSRSTFADHQGKFNTCVSCHLRKQSAESPDHHFVPETSDCATCHTGISSVADIRPANSPDYDGDGNSTEGIKGEIDSIRDALYIAIRTYGSVTVGFPIVYDANASSYWYRDTNGNGTRESTETTAYNRFDAALLKACYNYHMSLKEPHGYIHNHRYILQLLYDSLQDLGVNMTPYTRP